jgi:L-threonylcarbamoyladenylate synthase
MPAHPSALELLQKLGRPVVAPSANQFGKTSPTTAEHVAGEFGKDLVILDGGECEIGIESTIICCSGTEIQILRPGGISRSDLEKELREFSGVHITRSQSNAAPGQLSHHYQPNKSLIVYREEADLDVALRKEDVQLKDCFEIELPEDAKVAARKLYADLRAGDASNCNALILKWDHPFDGQWEGIWDRVQRAAKVITFR